MRLVLASGSPRRKELFSEMGIRYKSFPSAFDESTVQISDPGKGVCDLARGKAEAARDAWAKTNQEPFVVLGADTLVVLDGQPMGKPKDEDDAFSMLRRLSGREHSVYTGVAILDGEDCETFYSKTDVYFYDLSDEEIREYIATGEPMDKAGAYGIQGIGRLLVRKIDGDYYTVVGLPVAEVVRALKRHGIFTRFD